MHAGNLDRRVTLMARGPDVDDGITKRPGVPVSVGQRWASWKPVNGRRVFESLGREAVAAGSFWLRSDSVTRTLNETDIIRDENDRDWTIISIVELGRRDGLEFMVTSGD